MKQSLLSMKRWLRPAAFVPAVALSAVLAGCTQNPPEDPAKKEKVTIHASVESTRTSLGDDLSVVWSEGDIFYLLGADGNGELFDIVSGAGTNDASFEGYKPAGNSFVAVYPAGRFDAFDGLNVRMMFPATQTYARGSFAESANPMIATATGDVSEMFFKNVCGLLELQITGSGTLSQITLSSGSPMAGSADVDSNDLSLSWNDGYGHSLEITGINEELSTSEPLSVYCVLPPGNYESLEVRMTDSEGNTVTKTAEQPVVVERSKVTPVTGLVFENAVQAPVSIAIDPASNFKLTIVSFALTGSIPEADGIMYNAVTKRVLDDYLSQNPQNTLLSFLAENGTGKSSASCVKMYTTAPEMELVLLAAALSGANIVSDVVRMDYTTPAVKKDPSLNLTDDMVTFTCTETSIEVAMSLPAGAKRLHRLAFLGSVVEGADDETLYAEVLVYKDCGKDVEGTYTEGITELTPGTKYVWLFVVEGENGFSELYKAEISTEEHVASEASIEIVSMNISDVTAEFEFEISNAAYCMLTVVQRHALNVDLTDENALAAYIDSAGGLVLTTGGTTGPLGVRPSMDYVVLGLAYDAAGVYGRPVYAEFTTEYPIPGEDSPEYRQFIGQWKVSYTDLLNWEPVEMIVSVREHVVGKTYLVSGMMDPAARMQYSIDDEIWARFVDGKIVLDGMTSIADCGSLSGFYDVNMYVVKKIGDSVYLDNVNSLYGEMTDNGIVFTGSLPECVGYVFYGNSLSPDMGSGTIGSAYGDVVWQPYMRSASVGNTESFGGNPPVNPGWN